MLKKHFLTLYRFARKRILCYFITMILLLFARVAVISSIIFTSYLEWMVDDEKIKLILLYSTEIILGLFMVGTLTFTSTNEILAIPNDSKPIPEEIPLEEPLQQQRYSKCKYSQSLHLLIESTDSDGDSFIN